MPDDPFDTDLKEKAARSTARDKHLADPATFILAGDATFTVINHETGNRFTFKVERCEQPDTRHSVKVLTGSSYTYLGIIFDGIRYHHGKKSPVASYAQSAKTFRWIWGRIQTNTLPDTVEIYHEPE